MDRLLTVYHQEPTGLVDVELLERAACDRLLLLKEIERRRSNGEFESRMASVILSKAAQAGIANVAADDASHFLLRRALCVLPDAVPWLVRNEHALFRMRMNALNTADQAAVGEALIEHLHTGHRVRRLSELDGEAAGLVRSYASPLEVHDDEEVFVFGLAEGAGAILAGVSPAWRGECFVRRRHLWRIAMNRFPLVLASQIQANRAAVEQQEAKKETADKKTEMWADLDFVMSLEDLRVEGLVQLLQLAFRENTNMLGDAASRRHSVGMGDIEDLGKKFFPPCMQNLVAKSRQPSVRLKHADRRTLGIFLREIGLELDQGLQFWHAALHGREGRNWDGSDEYQVLNIYGRNGKRVLDGGKSCRSIVSESGDKHGVMNFGCPFVTMPDLELQGMLRRRALTVPQVDAVMANRRHCQVACRMLFQFSHGMKDPDEAGVGPNPLVFYQASVVYKKAN